MKCGGANGRFVEHPIPVAARDEDVKGALGAGKGEKNVKRLIKSKILSRRYVQQQEWKMRRN